MVRLSTEKGIKPMIVFLFMISTYTDELLVAFHHICANLSLKIGTKRINFFDIIAYKPYIKRETP